MEKMDITERLRYLEDATDEEYKYVWSNIAYLARLEIERLRANLERAGTPDESCHHQQRYHNALAINHGACNPSGIALGIVDACREIRAQPNHTGTAQITGDPAVRLMVHQLMHICKVREFDDLNVYARAVAEVFDKTGP